MQKHENHILINTCYGHFMNHFNMLVFPAIVVPLTGRLGMDMAAVLSLSFWMYLLFGCTALAWGIIADRWGGKALMRIYYTGAGISGLAAALWLDSPLGLTLALAALGLFSGIYHPTGLGLISKEIKRVSVGMGINGVFGNLGLASAPLLTGLVNWLWGPQAAGSQGSIASSVMSGDMSGNAASGRGPSGEASGTERSGTASGTTASSFVCLPEHAQARSPGIAKSRSCRVMVSSSGPCRAR